MLVAASGLAWAGFGTAKAQPKAAKLDKVTLQLKWGDAVAVRRLLRGEGARLLQGLRARRELKLGGPSITPEQVVASGQAQIGVDWLPSLLATRDTGTNLVNIAQMFARSGMTEITWKDERHHSIAGDAQQDGRRVVLR